ncbi:DUF6308 family protein [Dactylosporangium sp. NPDC051541]|uniref:DUF6308 family protein n=1 Tax=Dactylosporangium sp. NPDC051541 TaxID=3363977 RepID=UPI0037B52B97
MLEDREPRPMLTEGSIEQVERVAAVIDALLADQRTPAAVRMFYDPATQFAGDTFLSLAPNNPQSISPADLLAVTLLTVAPGAVAVRALLPGGQIADQVSELLTMIPADVPLWDATDLDLVRADILWNLLKTTAGVGPTIAGKVLARKRPELIPIVDRVVADRLECAAGTYWTTFRRVLQHPGRRALIAALRPDQPILRILDTTMWMHWRRGGPNSVLA